MPFSNKYVNRHYHKNETWKKKEKEAANKQKKQNKSEIE